MRPFTCAAKSVPEKHAAQYVVKRAGMGYAEFGLVDARAAKRQRAEASADAGQLPLELVEEWERFSSGFQAAVHDHTEEGALDLGAPMMTLMLNLHGRVAHSSGLRSVVGVLRAVQACFGLVKVIAAACVACSYQCPAAKIMHPLAIACTLPRALHGMVLCTPLSSVVLDRSVRASAVQTF